MERLKANLIHKGFSKTGLEDCIVFGKEMEQYILIVEIYHTSEDGSNRAVVGVLLKTKEVKEVLLPLEDGKLYIEEHAQLMDTSTQEEVSMLTTLLGL